MSRRKSWFVLQSLGVVWGSNMIDIFLYISLSGFLSFPDENIYSLFLLQESQSDYWSILTVLMGNFESYREEIGYWNSDWLIFLCFVFIYLKRRIRNQLFFLCDFKDFLATRCRWFSGVVAPTERDVCEEVWTFTQRHTWLTLGAGWSLSQETAAAH